MERVYELGRVYRNEGISPRHNPEFTMLEVYQAYGDYGSMMDLTEAIIADAIDAIDGNFKRPWGETVDRLHAAVRPQDLRRAVRRSTPASIRTTQAAREGAGRQDRLRHGRQASRRDQERGLRGAGRGRARRARSSCIDYPASICPLTKRKRSNPTVAERFELFVQGMELANAYTELNDPDLQEQLFKTQLAGHGRGRLDGQDGPRLHPRPASTACRPPAAWASASTGW